MGRKHKPPRNGSSRDVTFDDSSLLRRVPPAVALVTLVVSSPLGFVGARSLGYAAGLAAAGAAGITLVNVVLLHLLLAWQCKSRFEVKYYLWSRLWPVLAAAAIAAVIVHFALGWAWPAAIAAGPTAAIVIIAIFFMIVMEILT
jgi:hypothetical protein